MQNSYKYLFKNIGLLSLSQFGSKILIFFLVPLYTAILTTAEYGTYDIFSTLINLLLPILSLNITTAVIRFALDNTERPKQIFSIGLRIFMIGLLIFLLLVFLNYYLNLFSVLNQYPLFFIAMFIVRGIYQLFSDFARGIDKVSAVAIGSITITLVTIITNILFLVVWRWGIVGYFWATILGHLSAIGYFTIKLRLWEYIVFGHIDSKLQQSMLIYSIPMIITSVSWWINGSSDRFIVLAFCGMAANGIYAVAYKIPSILSILQNIFNQAWILSSVKDFDPEDKNNFFANIYNYYHYVLLLGCLVLILCTKIIAYFLYAKDFYAAWKYVPFLLIAVLFGAMSGFIGGIFATAKDTKAYGFSALGGAVLNIVLNLILVPIYGVLGAAIATTVSYFAIWQVRLLIMRRYIQLRIPLWKHYLAYILLITQSFLLLTTEHSPKGYYINISLALIILGLFYQEGISLYHKIERNILTLVYRGEKI